MTLKKINVAARWPITSPQAQAVVSRRLLQHSTRPIAARASEQAPRGSRNERGVAGKRGNRQDDREVVADQGLAEVHMQRRGGKVTQGEQLDERARPDLLKPSRTKKSISDAVCAWRKRWGWISGPFNRSVRR